LRFKLFPHKKDEAVALDIPYVERLPIGQPTAERAECSAVVVDELVALKKSIQVTLNTILNWLYHEFGIEKPGRGLSESYRFDADGFITAVRASLPKSRKWSAAEIARLKQEYAETLVPARQAYDNILVRERKLSDLVNAAYGLTPEEVALMWRTAPPRMPLDPAQELRRLVG
jgi:hypothetical protein